MVKPDLEDLIASLNSRYWVCEKCDESFPTKEEAEKHEEKCMLHGTGKTVLSDLDWGGDNVRSEPTSRTKSIEWSKPHNLLFVLGILMLLSTLLIVPEPSPQDITDCSVTPEDAEKCAEKLELQLTFYKWMNGLGLIFIFVGLYNTIRERRN